RHPAQSPQVPHKPRGTSPPPSAEIAPPASRLAGRDRSRGTSFLPSSSFRKPSPPVQSHSAPLLRGLRGHSRPITACPLPTPPRRVLPAAHRPLPRLLLAEILPEASWAALGPPHFLTAKFQIGLGGASQSPGGRSGAGPQGRRRDPERRRAPGRLSPRPGRRGGRAGLSSPELPACRGPLRFRFRLSVTGTGNRKSKLAVAPEPQSSPSPDMEGQIPYDDYPVVFLPPYENPPAWIPPHELGFNIRGGKASQLGIFISKVIPDSDAHRAGLQEGDQVLAVNEVDFQDIEHSKVRGAHPGYGKRTPSFVGLGNEEEPVAALGGACWPCFSFRSTSTFQAVEILKTAREISMRVRFFPYSKYRSHRPLALETLVLVVCNCRGAWLIELFSTRNWEERGRQSLSLERTVPCLPVGFSPP
uniref:PDZ domain-containing protein n=1 Tax=Monodelphis domestica TaxID=13616 RepID=F6VM95_MONDO